MTDAENERIKQSFREALDRKSHRSTTQSAQAAGDSKVHHTHGPAEHKREFRRKSG